MHRRHTLALTVALCLGLPVVVFAHHGWSEYDSSQPVKLTGTIQSIGYENPHGFIALKTADKTWEAILAPPSRMRSRGLDAELLKVGATATVEGFPNKRRSDEMRAERITIGDKTVELR